MTAFGTHFGSPECLTSSETHEGRILEGLVNACKHRQHRQHLITSLAWIPRPSQTPSRQLQDPPYEPKIAQDLPQTASDPSKRPQDRPRILSRQLQGPPRRAEDRPRPLQDSLRLLKTSPRPPKILLDAPKKISSGTSGAKLKLCKKRCRVCKNHQCQALGGIHYLRASTDTDLWDLQNRPKV